ncbi:MAG: hypothetical protein R3C19_22550 [Planctomycetaceae bacterium]
MSKLTGTESQGNGLLGPSGKGSVAFFVTGHRSPDWRMIDRNIPAPKFGVAGYRDGRGAVIILPLHHNMTAALPNLFKAMPPEDAADIISGKHPQPTQWTPRRA